MRTMTMKLEDVGSQWYVIDASQKILGRLATEIARRLRGKHKPEYTPNMDLGDHIIVINADKVCVTGNKATDKLYFRHSGYTGNLKTASFKKLLAEHPEQIIELAVKGMLPKGPLGYQMIKKLYVYKGSDHKHAAQQPKPLDIE